jgi:ribosomal protein L11 methylase PrmA
MRVRRLPVLFLVSISMFFVGQSGPVAAGQTAQQPALRAPDVIYVPTPHEVVEAMLKLAKVGPNDVVYDLGSGDGRIPIAAVQKFNAKKAIGVDINPERIKEATANHAAAGVGDKVTFILGDLFEQNIGEATVITLYLLPSLNVKLMPKLKAELKPGTRIVSQSFDMQGQWEPDETISVDGRSVYMWTIK